MTKITTKMENSQMKIKKNLSSNNTANVKKVIKTMFLEALHNRPIVFLAYTIQFIVNLARQFQFIILPKFLINELVFIYNGDSSSDHLKKIFFLVALTLSIMFFSNILDGFATWIKNLSKEWFNEYFQVKINQQSMSIDFECTEDSNVLDQMNKAKEGMDWYSGNVCGILDHFFTITSNIVFLLGVITVISISSPLVIIFQLISIAFFYIFNKKIKQVEMESFKNQTEFSAISFLNFQIFLTEKTSDCTKRQNCSIIFRQNI